MATTLQWDETFLKQRKKDEAELKVTERMDADWEKAVRQIRRERSDMVRGFVLCPAAKCHRARRCMEDEPSCLAFLDASLPWDLEQSFIEEVYAELQKERRIDDAIAAEAR